MIHIDGSYGEGGGQVVRTSLALAVLTGQPVRITCIRAGRSQPGLAPQHLTAVRAAASICGALVRGDAIGSQELQFHPGSAPQPGSFCWDVAETAGKGSAGSVGLVFQTVFLPLALAAGSSEIVLRGGTHVAWSPHVSYLEQVYLPALACCDLKAVLNLKAWGFYPVGGGELVVHIDPQGTETRPLSLTERAPLRRIWGTAAVSNLPSHIPQRMANRAMNVLAEKGLKAHVEAKHVRAKGPGVGIFLFTEDENGMRAGFTAYGRKGLPAEHVAEAACEELLVYYRSGAPVDSHLADQLVLPLAFASGMSRFTTSQVTEHLRTNMWVVERFGQATFEMTDTTITVEPNRAHTV
jgi:RNA 3'-terminal phosphate cyclase (ATP)